MGYGTYRDEESMNRQFEVQVVPNLKPKNNTTYRWCSKPYTILGEEIRILK